MIHYLHATGDLRKYQELCTDIYNGKCILLSSLGLSAQVRTKSGEHPPSHLKGLFEEVVDWCTRTGLIDQQEKEAICKRFSFELIDKAEIDRARYRIEEYLIDKAQQQQCLRKVLLCDQAEVSKIHYLLAQIPFRAYFTTSYDTFIEAAYSLVHQSSLPKFYKTSVLGAIDAYQNAEPFILKLNGDVDSADSIIFSNRDFKRLSVVDSRDKWHKLLSGLSVLFIGFEQDIINLESFHDLIDTAADLTYWIVLPKDQLSRSRAKQLWKNKRVNIIQYKSEETQTELIQFLEGLTLPQASQPSFEQEVQCIKYRDLSPKSDSERHRRNHLGSGNLQEPEQPKKTGSMVLLPKPAQAADSLPSSRKTCDELATLGQSDLTDGRMFSAHNASTKTQSSRTYSADAMTGSLGADVSTENLEAVETSTGITKSGTRTAIEVFFSYAYVDKNMQFELLKHLKIMKFKRRIIWHDKEIGAGKERAHEIEKLLDTVHIILLLVSVDFLTSLNDSGVEMKQALRRHREGKARVIPIILRPVYWHDAPFKKLQVLPANDVPMTSWPNLEEAYLHVATGVRKAIEDFIENF